MSTVHSTVDEAVEGTEEASSFGMLSPHYLQRNGLTTKPDSDIETITFTLQTTLTIQRTPRRTHRSTLRTPSRALAPAVHQEAEVAPDASQLRPTVPTNTPISPSEPVATPPPSYASTPRRVVGVIPGLASHTFPDYFAERVNSPASPGHIAPAAVTITVPPASSSSRPPPVYLPSYIESIRTVPHPNSLQPFHSQGRFYVITVGQNVGIFNDW